MPEATAYLVEEATKATGRILEILDKATGQLSNINYENVSDEMVADVHRAITLIEKNLGGLIVATTILEVISSPKDKEEEA